MPVHSSSPVLHTERVESLLRWLPDPAECIDCDASVEACPVDAITSEDQVPAEWERYIEINAAYYRDKQAAAS